MDDEIFARGTGAAQARPAKKTKNSRTVINTIGGVFAREPLGGQIALARYEPALRLAARDYPRDRVLVAVVDSDGRQTRHQILAPGESLVFGRHEQARLQHGSDDISLRHVAVAVAPSSTEDAPLLRLWDLETGRPFITEDGLPTKAITADGPVFATIGSVFVAIIPLGSLPMEAVESGILIGRYDRCLRIDGEVDALSRVHLLIKIGKDVIAIDTASTFGSVRSGGAFDSIVLRDKDELVLAGVLLVEWNSGARCGRKSAKIDTANRPL